MQLDDGWYDSKKKTAAILQLYKIITVDIIFRSTYLFYGTWPTSQVKNNTVLIKRNVWRAGWASALGTKSS